MIVVKCPKCGGCFSAPGPPPPLYMTCPSCHKTLRLRSRTGEDLFQPGEKDGGGWFVRKARGTWKALAAGLLAAGLVVAGVFAVRGMGRPAGDGSASTQPAPLPSLKPLTVMQSQREVARRRGTLIRLPPNDLFNTMSPAVVRVIVQSTGRRSVGQGSGFLVSPDGWLVTNYHVIEWADTATVVLSDYTDLMVHGVGAIDREADLALLKIGGKNLPCLIISPNLPPAVGTMVFAIGSPEGLMNTFSPGLISGHRMQHGVPILQTTAPVSYGSSGGPLLTDKGVVVGVTSRIRAAGQNLNFAIPASRVIDLLCKQGKIVRLSELHAKPFKDSIIVQLDLAWKALEKRDLDAAEKILKPLASVHTDNPFVLFAYGQLHRKRGAYALAIKAFEGAVKLKGDYAEAYYHIGVTYCDREALAAIVHDHGEALALEQRAKEALQNAVKFDPGGKIGRAARAAMAKHWPRQFRP